jgi:hypothetical protein
VGQGLQSWPVRAFSPGLQTGTTAAGLKAKPLVPAQLPAGTGGFPRGRLRAHPGPGPLVPVCNTDRD